MDENLTPRRASEWLVALSEAPNDAGLRDRLEAWIAASPANARDWDEMVRTHQVMGMTVPSLEGEWRAFAEDRAPGARSDLVSRTPAPRRRFGAPARAASSTRRPAGRLGVAISAAATCLALVVAPMVLVRLQADHATATAEVRGVQLADGSTVRLGPQSAIAVSYGQDGRRVRLLRGEAFFDVVHDPARPFRVTAGGVETTDLGTSFDVRVRGDGADIAVRSGLVQVDRTEASVSERLAAGEWLHVGAQGAVRRGVRPTGQIAAWLDGEVIAKDEPVSGVIDEIRPYYRGVILVRGARLARQPLTGVYKLSDPVGAVQAVAEAQGANVYRVTPWVMMISKP